MFVAGDFRIFSQVAGQGNGLGLNLHILFRFNGLHGRGRVYEDQIITCFFPLGFWDYDKENYGSEMSMCSIDLPHLSVFLKFQQESSPFQVVFCDLWYMAMCQNPGTLKWLAFIDVYSRKHDINHSPIINHY